MSGATWLGLGPSRAKRLAPRSSGPRTPDVCSCGPMQSHDAPFQTGSASHSPLHHPAHHSPSSSSFPDATATASHPSASPHHPSAARMNRLSRSYSGSNTPAPLAAPYIPPPAAHTAARPDRDDASGSRRSPSLSRHGSASTASDVPIPMSRTTSASGAPSRADKGKGVARDGLVGQADAPDDPDEQQRRVERVLQRAEASRVRPTLPLEPRRPTPS